jgi:integrase
VSWDEARQCFVASVTVGYAANGKRIVRRGMGKTEAVAKARLKERVRDYQAGLAPDARLFTVRNAAEDWLSYGLAGRSPKTVEKWTSLCRTHVVPSLGARKIRDLTATDVDRWLMAKSAVLSSRRLDDLYRCLQRIVRRAMARGYVERNVVELCDVPDGQVGRPSKSLTLDQAVALLGAAEGGSLEAYVTVALMVGARTEELRALRWDHVDLDGRPDRTPPVPPSIQVWRSVREGGDTKTRKSRRTLALPARCV